MIFVRYVAFALLAIFFGLLAVFVLGPLQWFQDRKDRRAEREYRDTLSQKMGS